MPILSNTNKSPWFDDFDPEKGFYKVMFNAGRPVQARELTQLQSILGNQIEEFASRFFKNGDVIVNGGFSLGIPTKYVRVSSITQGAKPEEFIGYTLTGVISGAKAEVTYATESTDTDDITFYVNYIDSGVNSEQSVFVEGEILESNTPDFYTATVGINATSKPIDTPPLGDGSLITVQGGTYYVNGYMVRSQEQTITLDKYGTKPTTMVGYIVDEDFVTSAEDESLKDNAQGHSNFAAPGADRLRIQLILSTKDEDTELPNFIPIVNLLQGNIIGSPTQTVKWDWLYDILAKRTFDESGDYIVTDFQIKPMEYWNDETVDGVFDPEEDRYGELTPYPPVPGSKDKNPLSFIQADGKYVLQVSPGTAYVQGYHVGYVTPFYIYGEKPRTLSLEPDTFTQINPGVFTKLTNVYGTPDVSNMKVNQMNAYAFDTINTYRNFIDGHVGTSFGVNNYAKNDTDLTFTDRRPQNTGNEPWLTYHLLLDDILELRNSIQDSERYNGQEVITVEKRDGNTFKVIVVYPNKSTEIQPATNQILRDPDSFRLVQEGGDNAGSAILADSEDDNIYTIKGSRSYVVAIDPEYLAMNPGSLMFDEETYKQVYTIHRGDKLSTSQGGARVTVSQKIDKIMSGVVKPKYMAPNTLVSSNNGFYGYNSIFDLGVLKSEFYTELAVVDAISTTRAQYPEEWIVGLGIRGEISGATAKVEQSRENFLIISNIRGSFIPGENIIQDQSDVPQELLSKILEDPNRRVLNDEVSNIIYADTPYDEVATIKKGRLLREGEIIDLHFNSFFGMLDGGGGDRSSALNSFNDYLQNSVNKPGNDQSPARVFTDTVWLTHPTVKEGIRKDPRFQLPDEEGFNTQEGANYWFYNAIKAIQFEQEVKSTVNVGPNPPENPNKNDLWIYDGNYTMYVYDDDAGWIGLTEEEAQFTPLINFSSFASDISDQFDVVDTREVTPEDFILEDITDLLLYGVGSIQNLSKSEGHFVYDTTNNTIRLTEKGRDAVYKNAFFNPQQSVESPRINYELLAYVAGQGSYYSCRGYAVTVPAKITNTIKKTKSFWSDLADDNDFSADAALDAGSAPDIYKVANGGLFTGSPGYNFVTCDNYTSDASEQLVSGDIVVIANDSGESEYKLVSHVTKPYGYGESRTKSSIYFTTAVEKPITGKIVERVRLRSFGSSDESLIYQLPISVVQSLETNQEATGIEYKIYKEFATTLSANETSLEFTCKANQEFISDPLKITVAIAELNGANVDDDLRYQYEGRLLLLDRIEPVEILDGGRKIKLNLQQPISKDCIVKALLPLEVINAKSRRKILKKEHIIRVPIADSATLQNGKLIVTSPAAQQIISLEKADIYKVNYIKTRIREQLETDDLTDPDIQYSVDITNNYILDDGQRDTFYGLGSIVRKDSAPAPDTSLEISFDYFEHDTSYEADFFSVDSYTHDQGVPYSDIPVYKPTSVTADMSMTGEQKSTHIKLRDCVDFRPVVNTTGEKPSYIPAISALSTNEASNFYNELHFNGDAIVPGIPIPKTQFRSDISYFLPKIDTLFLDKTGKMILKEGIPSQSPVAPEDISTGIRLYDLYMPAYTFDLDDIVIRKYNHRRYTMKDILDIDRRVERVEKLVSLSLLEQSAINMNVRDAVTGLDRFKNGVVVDSFQDHSRGDVGNSQYRCSIDPKLNQLRSPFMIDQITLEEKNQTNEQREVFGNYESHNNILTCKYDNVNYISQPTATRSTPIQLHTTTSFEGKIKMEPSIDTFYDTNARSTLVIETNPVYDAMVNLTDDQVQAGMGTVWAEWETDGRLRNRKVNQYGRGQNYKKNSDLTLLRDSSSFHTIRIGDTQASILEHRNQVGTGMDPTTTSVVSTSYGDRVLDLQLSRLMRSIPVKISAVGLKPNTRYYAFFDDVNVSDWVCIDNLDNTYPDGVARYNGSPSSDPKGFGLPLISDGVGNLQGVFIIPSGRAPEEGTIFNGSMEDIQYRTSGSTRSFTIGQRAFKLVDSPYTDANLTDIQGYARTDFISRPVLHDKLGDVVSTREPSLTTNRSLEEDVRFNYTGDGENYDPTSVPSPITRTYDPLAQSFQVDNNYPDGLFVTELDLFFRDKDANQGVEVYLVSTEGGLPTSVVLPHSKVHKNSDTTLRVVCELIDNLDSTTIEAGVRVRGESSGATGIVKEDVAFSSQATNSLVNVFNTTYNLILENYEGEFIPGETLVPDVNPKNANTFTIAPNEVELTRIDIQNMGENYTPDDYEIVIGEPNLPGGVRATAEFKVATPPVDNTIQGRTGNVYDVKITQSGSGYTKAPSVNIQLKGTSTGNGTGCILVPRITDGRMSVDMGVAVSDDATSATKFKFDAPVYLLGNKTYAFVVKSPSSKNYTLWTAKIGENKIGTSQKVITQPNTGVMYTSQSFGVWKDEQDMDITFKLHRASFAAGEISEITFNNAPLSARHITENPIEVNKPAIQDDASAYFGENAKVIRIHHYNHGFTKGDMVMIDGAVMSLNSGIDSVEINNLHQILDVSMHSFTIKVDLDVDSVRTGRYGGDSVMCSFSRPYETINLYSGLMSFQSSQIIATNRSAYYGGLPSTDVSLDNYTTNYQGFNHQRAYTLDREEDIPLMETYYYSKPRVVSSQIGEAQYSDDDHLRQRKSLETRIKMGTTDERLSPVVDLDRTNLNIVKNLIDKPQPYSMSTEEPSVGIIEWDGDRSELEPGDTFTFVDNTGEMRHVMVSDITSESNRLVLKGSNHLKGLFTARNIRSLPLNSTNVKFYITHSPGYKSEELNNGSAFSKYISQMFVFENQCDGIEVKLSSILYNVEDIKVYYKTRSIGYDGDFSQISWIPFNKNQSKPNETDFELGESVGYTLNQSTFQYERQGNPQLKKTPGLADNVGVIKVRNSPDVDPRNIMSSEWQSLTWSAQDLSKFDAIAIKIVMTSDNSALAPIIDDCSIVVTE